MNIAIVTDTYFPDINGVTSSIFTLSESLKSKGHKVYVFTVSEPKSVLRKLKADPTIYRFPSIPLVFIKPHRATLPFSVRMIRMMRKLKIDIIHTQSEFFMGFVGVNAAIALNIPIIHTYHTMLEDYTHYVAGGRIASKKFARRYSRVFCNMTDSVIVPTAKVEASLLSYGVRKPLYVIPTGIDLEPFRRENISDTVVAQLKSKLGIDPSHRLILCLGRVAKEKSIDLAISVLPDIVRLIPDARLLIVGDGPALPKLRELAKSLAVEQYIYFSGAVTYSEIGKYYRLGDVFLCCSVTETQGLTYYEAMASGTPVIARKDDSIRNLLIDRENCRMFQDSKELPLIVSELLSDTQNAARLSAKAREAMEFYSASTFGSRVEDAYKNTIDRTRLALETRKNSMVRFPTAKVMRGIKLIMPSVRKGIHNTVHKLK